jgi:RNA-directed DNA polymerase
MALKTLVARALAHAFLNGRWHVRVLMARGAEAVPDAAPWVRDLAIAVMQRWKTPPVHDERALTTFIERFEPFDTAWRRRTLPHRLPAHLPLVTSGMGLTRWPIKPLVSVTDVAQWLQVDDGQLEWFADRRGRNPNQATQPLMHYRCRWVARENRLPRLLEAPKDRLKSLQRKILREVLCVVPAHDAAHGFVSGRSPVTHAAVHQGQRVVVRFDLDSFFTHLQAPRVLHLFTTLGYPREVAAVLTGLCTTQTPAAVLRAATAGVTLRNALFHLQRRLAEWHLPQGAPTSPALANLTSWALDVRLTALAESLGATYSRYADDLVFSGGASLRVGVLTRAVAELVRNEGFRLNVAKTRVQRAHRRQAVTGLVVNAGVGIARDAYDRLKAEVHQFDGDVARIAGLHGKIAWVEHVSPRRGEKLRALLKTRLLGDGVAIDRR